MWMECLVQRDGPFEVAGAQGARYYFRRFPAEGGRQIAFVADERDQALFQRTGFYVPHEGPTPEGDAVAAAASVPAPPVVTAQTGGINVDALSGDALRQYAREVGMTRVPPTIRDDTLRARIKEHLEMQHEQDLSELTGGQ